MPISFTCKCGRQLRAKDDQAGKKVQCPACGRALTVPPPPEEKETQSTWRIDKSEAAAQKAESTGVIRRTRGHVVLLHSDKPLTKHVKVEGVITCWNCKNELPLSHQIFGRIGLSGPLVSTSCVKCLGKIWLSFSSHASGEGTDVYIYSLSHTREDATSENQPIAAPSFQVDRVAEVPLTSSRAETEWINGVLPDFIRAVSQKEPYQEVSNLAARLVGHGMSQALMEGVARSLRTLLDREEKTYLKAILVESLACLRDDRAGPNIQAALRKTLEVEDPSDQTNVPLHDLCVLSLLFGDGNGFLAAMNRGMKKLPITTRGYKLRKQLNPKEIVQLIEHGINIDTYESTLGGTNWEYIQPLLPLWVDEDKSKEKQASKGWINRLFRK